MGLKPIGMLLAAAAALSLAAAASAAPRAEARLGYAGVGLDVNVGGTSFEIEDDGFSYGAEIGYDFDALPILVFGPYASFDLASAELCDASGCAESDWTLGLGARVGAEFAPRLMAYVKGGYALTQVGSAGGDETDGGYQVGAGLQLDLLADVYVKGEFVYSEFGEEDFIIGSAGFSQNLAVAGVGLQF